MADAVVRVDRRPRLARFAGLGLGQPAGRDLQRHGSDRQRTTGAPGHRVERAEIEVRAVFVRLAAVEHRRLAPSTSRP